MQVTAVIAICGIIITILLNAAGYLIAYGMLRATVGALSERVKSLETEMKAMGEIKVHVAELRTGFTFMMEQFKELNASIRWMRGPSDFETKGGPGHKDD